MLGLWITFWVEWTDQVCGRADGLFKSVYFLHWWFIVFNVFVSVKHLAIGLLPARLYSKHAIYILLPLSINVFQLIFMMPTFHTAYFKLDCFQESRKKTIILWMLILSGICILMQALLLLWVGLADAPNMNLNKNTHRPEQAFEIPGMPSFTQIEKKGKDCATNYCKKVVETYQNLLNHGGDGRELKAAVVEVEIPPLVMQEFAENPEEPLYTPPKVYPESLAVSITDSVDLAYRSQVDGLYYFCHGRLREIIHTALTWTRYMSDSKVPSEVIEGYVAGVHDVIETVLAFDELSMTNPLTFHMLNHLAASLRSRLCQLALKISRSPDIDVSDAFKKIIYEVKVTHTKFVTMYRRRQAAPDWADGNQSARLRAIEFKTSLELYLFDVSLSIVEADYTCQFTYLHGKYVHIAAKKSAPEASKILWEELRKGVPMIDSLIDEFEQEVGTKGVSEAVHKRFADIIRITVERSEAEAVLERSISDSSKATNNEPINAGVIDEDPQERLAPAIAIDLAKEISSAIRSFLSNFTLERHMDAVREPAVALHAEKLKTAMQQLQIDVNLTSVYLNIIRTVTPGPLGGCLPTQDGSSDYKEHPSEEPVRSPADWALRNQALRMKDIVTNTPELFEGTVAGGYDARLQGVRAKVARMMLVDVLAIEKSFTLDGYNKVRRSSKRLRKGLRQIDKDIPPKWYDKNAIGLLAVVGGANVGFSASFDALPRPPIDNISENLASIADLFANFDTKVAKLVQNMDESMDEAIHRLSNIDECLNNMSNPLMLIAGVLRAFPFMTKGFALLATSAVFAVSLVSFVAFAQWYSMIHSKYSDQNSSDRFVNTYGVMVWIQLFQVLQCFVMLFIVLIGGNKLEYQLSFKVLIAVIMMMSTAQLNVSSMFSFTLSQKYDTVLQANNQTDPYCDAKYAFQACSPTRTALVTSRLNMTGGAPVM
eukprot:TRINITY_DN22267_c0_g1_i1.p1 TRINITY_DN22267_c0_g1~~TRINITY_DN22267_c0_g1_i1.p1  ORF type:complete len:1010 (+),score=265.58 TRINITY_DN22267_c0_g1_i1:216-3032(+)